MTPPTERKPADPGPDGVKDREEVAVELQSADVLAAYRAARDVVPEGEVPRAETRAAVLAAAARAIDARPQLVGSDGVVRRSGSRYGLRLPLALAASLLVGTVAWQLAAQFDASPSSEQVASAPVALPASSAESRAASTTNASPAAAARSASTSSPVAEPLSPPAPARTPLASPPPAPTEPTGVPPLARAASDENAAPRAASARMDASPAASASTVDSAPRRADPPGLKQSSERRSNVADPPARTVGAWLERIAELRRGGRDADADAEIRALRLAYPEAQIPPALLLPLPR